jgi:hypothetical protein
MSTNGYITNRKVYKRPQAMLWSENPGRIDNGLYVPDGLEIGQDLSEIAEAELANQFLVLSDDNRQPIDFSINRIEKRERTINGRMRSYHIADKLSIRTSWSLLPSRSYFINPDFTEAGVSPYRKNKDIEFTSDGGAGGVEMLRWYETHTGPFWVYLAYDRYDNFDTQNDSEEKYFKLQQYNEIVEMYITEFSYSLEKRGGTNHDFWNISVSLEEA